MNQARATRNLCVLSFDGGGIRGLSSLFILREIMRRLNGELTRRNPAHETLHPWQVFDMICGTSTGGLIAIMLGRLHMSVDGVIEAYAKLAGRIFSETKWWWKEGRYKACRLVKAINVTVGENTPHDTQADETLPLTKEEKDQRNAKIGHSIRMLDPREDEERCSVFVCAVAADNGAFQPRLRTYPVIANATPNCAIWEAARATSAAPYFFKPTIIYENNTSMRIIDGGLGCNNPTLQLLDEVAGRFPTRRIACILSLGTGQRSVIQLRAAGGIPKLQLFGMYKMLQKISTDCEETHAQISDRFQNRLNVYFRLNVEQGMQGVGLEEWKKLGQVRSHTLAYTQTHTASRNIDNVVVALIDRHGFVTVEQAAGKINGQV